MDTEQNNNHLELVRMYKKDFADMKAAAAEAKRLLEEVKTELQALRGLHASITITLDKLVELGGLYGDK